MTVWSRFLRAFMACVLAVNTGLVPGSSFAAQPATVLDLPEPGTMLYVTPDFHPAIIRGVTIDADNPLQFDFLIDTGEQDLDGVDLQRESTRLIKYFLAALTVSEDKMWVNLSPFERDRIIPDEFGRTEMGRDLLAQDYLLKQLTASMIYPEDELGKKFWDRVYQRAQTEFGTTDVPVNTYNKIWIVPETADVVVQGQTVYVVNSRLKVMLEEDYLALEHHSAEKPGDTNVLSEVSSQIVREILIPEIEREVNNGRTFSNLRQIYHSMILAIFNGVRQTVVKQVPNLRRHVRGGVKEKPSVVADPPGEHGAHLFHQGRSGIKIVLRDSRLEVHHLNMRLIRPFHHGDGHIRQNLGAQHPIKKFDLPSFLKVPDLPARHIHP